VVSRLQGCRKIINKRDVEVFELSGEPLNIPIRTHKLANCWQRRAGSTAQRATTRIAARGRLAQVVVIRE
jgi:hypothetical protein